jgi:4,5-dihydroxyphthalate decarboxylase
MATTTILQTLLGTYPHTQALKDGTVKVPGIDFEYSPIEPVFDGFGRMADDLQFDVSEMALATYFLARDVDRPIALLPIVVLRGFHHSKLVHNVNSGLKDVKDLEGRRVGVRSYTQTTPTWTRGFLQADYGVDLDKITWVTFEASHVKSYQNPPNVVRAPEGKTLNGMLLAGEIDAAIGASATSPDLKELIPNAAQVEAEWFKRTGVYPVNHFITVKSDLIAARPGILRDLWAAFKEAKQILLDRLNGPGPFSNEEQSLIQLKSIVGDDPLPYGVAANRKAIEMVAQFAYDQRIARKVYSIEELFLPEVMAFA